MGKYPSRDGLAVSPYELGFTEPTPEQITTHKRVEFHHIYHYGRYYDQESDGYGAWRQVFRNMVANVVPLLIEEHNGAPQTLHGRYRPPQIPKDALMIDVLEQEITESGLILQHTPRRAAAPRIITPDQWQAKKRRYKSGKAC